MAVLFMTVVCRSVLLGGIALLLTAAGPDAPTATVQAAGVTLRSVGFAFPASDRAFPEQAGADLVSGNCQSCHSSGMVLNQPALTRAEWTGEVNKMIHVYKAPVSDEDAAGIIAYLTAMTVGP